MCNVVGITEPPSGNISDKAARAKLLPKCTRPDHRGQKAGVTRSVKREVVKQGDRRDVAKTTEARSESRRHKRTWPRRLCGGTMSSLRFSSADNGLPGPEGGQDGLGR